MQKTILITGGAGYIGSHTAYLLHMSGYNVIIVDALMHHQPFSHQWAHLIKSDYGRSKALSKIFDKIHIDAVMHFAGFIEVGESVKRPATFYHNNVGNTLQLLDVMRAHGVDTFIFSSSCAVYGVPQKLPLDEQHPLSPINPYGRTKLIVEYLLQDYAQAYGMRYASLRYFNAAGSFVDQGLGEWHHPETHAIPLLLRAAAAEQPFTIFGDDYDTVDGTCVRDYVHVGDIAQAHLKALHYLEDGNSSSVFNLGTGQGWSVRQLVEAAEKITRRQIKTTIAPRRDGDVPALVASAHKAYHELHWRPQLSDLDTMLRSAWEWERHRSSMKTLSAARIDYMLS